MVLAPAGVGDDHAGVEPVGEGLVAVLRVVEFDLLDLSDPAVDGSVEVVAAPGDARVVAVLAQVFGKGAEAAGERHVEAGHVHRYGRTPRHDRGARRHALRRGGVGAVEAHALGGETVEIRRPDVGVAVTADGEGALVVAQHQQDVGLFLGRDGGAAAQDAAAEQQTGFQSGFHAFSALRFVSFVSRKPVRKMTVVPKTIVR